MATADARGRPVPARTGPLARLGSLRPSARRTPIPVRAAGAAGDRWSACYAPHTSMYFDQMGKVRACCQNTGVYLGDVRTQTLREIWTSAEADEMRRALEADDYSAGCTFCAWQVREGNDATVFARNYDGLEPGESRPRWPRQMEFSLTNTCNLQCAMCYGELSSSIRSKREGLPPLPVVYHDDYFAQLAEFLPHLEEVKFLGGEPFLGREPLVVMEMLAELADPPQVSITTNGTIHTARVERIVERLRPNIVVSLDGATDTTFDAIRVGAHFADVVANLDWFISELGPERVSLATCLMPQNWHEFADVLELAEQRGIPVGVNVVRFPAAHSLYHLSADELAPIVQGLAARVPMVSGTRLDAWQGQLDALTLRLEVVRADDPGLGPVHGLAGAELPERWWLPFAEQRSTPPGTNQDERSGLLADLHVDRDGRITVHWADDASPLPISELDGEHVERLTELLLTFYAWATWDRRVPGVDDEDLVRVVLEPLDPAATRRIELSAVARRDDAEGLVGARYRMCLVPAVAIG